MKIKIFILALPFFLIAFFSCSNVKIRDQKKDPLLGNNIIAFSQWGNDSGSKIDTVDDTIHFKHVIDKFYRGDSGKIYLRTACIPEPADTNMNITLYEYYLDYSDFIDLKTYRKLSDECFINRGKVYFWFMNDSYDYVNEIDGADAGSFIPIPGIYGGKDKRSVFYGSGGPQEIKRVYGADPKSIRALILKSGTGVYFADNKNVFYEFAKIAGADPKTFKILDEDSTDAMDKSHKYFEGRVVHR